MTALTPVGVPPYDYPGAVYDPGLWAEVGLLPPVKPYVEPVRRLGGETYYVCGAQVWVYYLASIGRDFDSWELDSIGTTATTSDEAMRLAIGYMPEMAAHRASVMQENATVIDA
jgi:hypothetical protein